MDAGPPTGNPGAVGSRGRGRPTRQRAGVRRVRRTGLLALAAVPRAPAVAGFRGGLKPPGPAAPPHDRPQNAAPPPPHPPPGDVTAAPPPRPTLHPPTRPAPE